MTKTLLAAATALPLAFVQLAAAQAQAPATAPPESSGVPAAPPGSAAPTAEKLSEPAIIRALKGQGYGEIRTVRRNGNVLLLHAKKAGKPVRLVVNTATGRYTERPR